MSTIIESLKNDSTLSTWIHEGLRLHQERKIDNCLFCEQRLPSDRITALENHFNDAFDTFHTALDNEISLLQGAVETTTNCSLHDRARFYEELVSDWDKERAAFGKAIESTKQTLKALIDALTNKKSRPFEIISLTMSFPEVDYGSLGRMNRVIGDHNEICENLQTRVATARNLLELHYVSDSLEDFNTLENLRQSAEQTLAVERPKRKQFEKEIKQLEREIVQHRQPVEELNKDLHNYLAHQELHFSVKDTGYEITRNSVPVTELSEGESTAVALLYFLKTLTDHRFDINRGVVVLDDPVSSLDSNALYLAFGFIRERTKDAGQLFIFTHNFTFFKEVKNWFHHLKGQKKPDEVKRPARFYMLDCAWDNGQRSSEIVPLDPLLEDYESEYHYLFARVYWAAHDTSATALEENYVLPNMARRLLEGFLAFRQPQVSGELWRKLGNVDFDEVKKLRVLRFVHTHSHSDSIGESEHDPSLLAEAPSVLQDILDFMKDQDAKHFEAMAKLARTPAERDDDE